MKVELDENLGLRGRDALAQVGFDVATVVDQDLARSDDVTLIEVCRAEGRCLTTLDLDLGSPACPSVRVVARIVHAVNP